MPAFPEHGTFQVKVIGYIILATLKGQWNDITTEKYLNEIKISAKEIGDQPWVLLADMSEWEFVEISGYDLGRDFNDREFDRSHQTHEIWITSNKTVIKMLSKVTQLPEHVVFQSYANSKAALDAMQHELPLSPELLHQLNVCME